mgnify:FL=1
MGFLDGKRALIVGLASNRSIAWGIAQAMHRQGARITLTYQNDRLAERVKKLGNEVGCEISLPCDLAEDDQIRSMYSQLGHHWDGLDIIVHSAAFAPREELEGDYVDNVTRAGSALAHDISSYSFAALAKYGRALLRDNNGSLLTLSYLGSERAMPNYNIMGPAKASLEANVRYMALSLGAQGTRVNAISAGPIRTLAAAGIADFRSFLNHVEENAPLKRNVTIDEVGNTAAFLCSDLASGITGEIIHVDAGFNIAGMTASKA